MIAAVAVVGYVRSVAAIIMIVVEVTFNRLAVAALLAVLKRATVHSKLALFALFVPQRGDTAQADRIYITFTIGTGGCGARARIQQRRWLRNPTR